MTDEDPQVWLEQSMQALQGIGPDNIDLDFHAIYCANAAADAGYRPAVHFILYTMVPFFVRQQLSIHRESMQEERSAVRLMRDYVLERIDTATFTKEMIDLGFGYSSTNTLSGPIGAKFHGKKWTQRFVHK